MCHLRMYKEMVLLLLLSGYISTPVTSQKPTRQQRRTELPVTEDPGDDSMEDTSAHKTHILLPVTSQKPSKHQRRKEQPVTENLDIVRTSEGHISTPVTSQKPTRQQRRTELPVTEDPGDVSMEETSTHKTHMLLPVTSQKPSKHQRRKEQPVTENLDTVRTREGNTVLPLGPYIAKQNHGRNEEKMGYISTCETSSHKTFTFIPVISQKARRQQRRVKLHITEDPENVSAQKPSTHTAYTFFPVTSQTPTMKQQREKLTFTDDSGHVSAEDPSTANHDSVQFTSLGTEDSSPSARKREEPVTEPISPLEPRKGGEEDETTFSPSISLSPSQESYMISKNAGSRKFDVRLLGLRT
ncbi:uncharacterized protein LOC122732127 [Dromiciops gliroides]|uniref:uncharacterized protein LOC122732127 n=1 Tax=Dromiciops gliroides TaxID=33562 RepID=UPI001CC373BC|nr:uncharacterized protein LOC122732127 [Dromiciops gliroides]